MSLTAQLRIALIAVLLLLGPLHPVVEGQSDPWLSQPCDNTLLGLGGTFPALSGYYYVQLFGTASTQPDPGASISGPQYEFIVSLCNRTVKSPRLTRPCALSRYFIGIWSSNGDCVAAFDTIVRSTTIKNFNGTGGPQFELNLGSSINSSLSYAYDLRCSPATTNNPTTTEATTTKMVQVAQDICFAGGTVAPTPSPSGNGGGDGGEKKKNPKDVIIPAVVVPVLAAACIGLGVGIGVLYMRRRRLPVVSDAQEEVVTEPPAGSKA